MVYSCVITTSHITIITTKDWDVGGRIRNCDELRSFVSTGYSYRGSTYIVPVSKLAYGATRFEELKGSSV